MNVYKHLHVTHAYGYMDIWMEGGREGGRGVGMYVYTCVFVWVCVCVCVCVGVQVCVCVCAKCVYITSSFSEQVLLCVHVLCFKKEIEHL